MGRHRQTYVRVEIEVDVDEVFEGINNETLLAEVSARQIGHPHRDAVAIAIAQIRRGDTLDAITTLEREFWPKWASVEDSEAALRTAQQEAALPSAAA